MNELYWITRLDGICILLGIVSIITAILAIIAFAGYHITKADSKDGTYKGGGYGHNYIPAYNFWKGIKNKLLVTALITTPLFVLCPTTKEAYMIYGVGGTIDYLKSNETAKQIPDKCIKAIDKWLENKTDSIK